MRATRPFGLSISTDSALDIANAAIRQRLDDGVALVVTPNIDHIATMRRFPPLAEAYDNAARIVCDGWPVQAYARWCGLRIGRVTGCEIITEIMRMAPYPAWQRLFFVVDSAETERGVRDWAAQNGVVCNVTVPPFGFDRDAGYCARLAEAIR
jgi:UDP-N-acetyl-D-mannosaminuronic acid transferase (WecB/TagA/CpsF family)